MCRFWFWNKMFCVCSLYALFHSLLTSPAPKRWGVSSIACTRFETMFMVRFWNSVLTSEWNNIHGSDFETMCRGDCWSGFETMFMGRIWNNMLCISCLKQCFTLLSPDLKQYALCFWFETICSVCVCGSVCVCCFTSPLWLHSWISAPPVFCVYVAPTLGRLKQCVGVYWSGLKQCVLHQWVKQYSWCGFETMFQGRSLLKQFETMYQGMEVKQYVLCVLFHFQWLFQPRPRLEGD